MKNVVMPGDRVIAVNVIDRTVKIGVFLGMSKFKFRIETGSRVSEDILKAHFKLIPHDETLFNALRDASMGIQIAARKFDHLV